MSLVEKFRRYRSKKLEKIAKAIANLGINANHITTLSFLSGIAAIYFLFNNYHLFVVFALLHLVFDGLDGVIARVTKPTAHGKYFDLISDSAFTFLAMVKTGIYLREWYAYLAAGLFLLALIIHLASKLEAPILFMRTMFVIVLVIITHPSFAFTEITLTAGYLAAGGVSLFSLARQLQWYVVK
ncbi:MAG TPA: CDP-alcohol phosphatidyltransferase family protein [Candidatus Nanoarchaeia archaeon]|nr:CDP-alcohol phosphatidyltransferase family protein [Candidatus Nanoarchaeia archaeon]